MPRSVFLAFSAIANVQAATLQVHSQLQEWLAEPDLAAPDLPRASAGHARYATYVELPTSTGARCLDGTPYGFGFCRGSTNASWTLNMQGGGWCYNETLCAGRATTPLGSSKTWRATTARQGCPAEDTNYVFMWYGDGASFSGYRRDPWPVPSAPRKSLYFRGARNMDATLDHLFGLGLKEAEHVTITGGSAGGLSTFLHLDHYQARITQEGRADARVLGNPVCGFFLDRPTSPYAPTPGQSYTKEMEYVFKMQNAGSILSSECQTALAPDSWKCIMAPHAAPFIKTPWFAFQSRFDKWQLQEEDWLPCIADQPYRPPFKPSTCDAKQDAMIRAYGPAFMAQFDPLRKVPGTRNGAFIDACIIHGSTNSSIDGVNNLQAFKEWANGAANGGESKQWWVETCDGSETAGPCDPSPVCAPFP